MKNLNLPDFKPCRRAMCFIDGENIAIGYKRMLDSNPDLVSKDSVIYKEDVLAWNPIGIIPYSGQYEFDFIRSYYYTSTGSGQVEEIENALLDISIFSGKYSHLYFHPVVFEKKNRNRKSKGVDIQIAIDILSHTYKNNLDFVFLFTGDADYIPIVEEVYSSGKRVIIGSFSDGFSPKLRNKADGVIHLDYEFFTKSS